MFLVPRPSLFAYTIFSCRSRAACIAWGPGLYKNQRWGDMPVHRRTLTFAFPNSLAWMSTRASRALLAPLDSDSPWGPGGRAQSRHHCRPCQACLPRRQDLLAHYSAVLWSRHACKPWHDQPLKASPHTQIGGLSAISQSYLSFRASRNSPLFRVKPISSIGRTVSQLDVPFSEASSTARCSALQRAVSSEQENSWCHSVLFEALRFSLFAQSAVVS